MATEKKVLLIILALLIAASAIMAQQVYTACMAEMHAWWFCFGLVF